MNIWPILSERLNHGPQDLKLVLFNYLLIQLIDGSTVLVTCFSDVILVTLRSLLFKENNVTCYIQGKWWRGPEELLTVHFLKVA